MLSLSVVCFQFLLGASDHHGADLGQTLLGQSSIQSEWIGPLSPTKACDYPLQVQQLMKRWQQTLSEKQTETQAESAVKSSAKKGSAKKGLCGLLICGSGLGMSIAANRFPGIRAALCRSVEDARLARQHNDANVLILGAKSLTLSQAQAILKVFLETPFEGGRHQRRVDQLDTLGG